MPTELQLACGLAVDVKESASTVWARMEEARWVTLTVDKSAQEDDWRSLEWDDQETTIRTDQIVLLTPHP